MAFNGKCAVVIVSIVCWATAPVDPRQQPSAEGESSREKRFVVFAGDGVPADYDDDDDDDVPYDYDPDVDDLDLDDGYHHHHVWWHHFYHHGEPHLPFPLFPVAFVPRRPLHRSCDQWPFPCTTSYEVIRWLQCYYEYVAAAGAGAVGGSSLLPVRGSWNE